MLEIQTVDLQQIGITAKNDVQRVNGSLVFFWRWQIEKASGSSAVGEQKLAQEKRIEWKTYQE